MVKERKMAGAAQKCWGVLVLSSPLPRRTDGCTVCNPRLSCDARVQMLVFRQRRCWCPRAAITTLHPQGTFMEAGSSVPLASTAQRVGAFPLRLGSNCRSTLTQRKMQTVAPTWTQVTHIGSVLAQIAFPLHASEMSDKSETGRDKHVSVPAESSHFFLLKKLLYRRGQNVAFFGKDVTKNVTS